MKICILGTRGIPNYYGGFEQFSEYLALYLSLKGHEVVVYNSHYHPYKNNEWKGVKIVHKFDPENRIGTVGQFFYDLNCILDSRKRQFDVILQLGYTSSSIWGRLLPRKSKIITNMDGLEWKRSKYFRVVQRFLLFAEKLGVKYSDLLVADSIGIQKYLNKKYKVESTFIPYGAHVVELVSKKILRKYNVLPYKYSMLIARLEPENSIETILDGARNSEKKEKFLVVGNHNTRYGKFLKTKYCESDSIQFLGGIYEIDKLNSLRHYAKLYFHGHTVGGTNPSLLEAMGAHSLICAHKNIFNESVLGNDAYYFTDSDDVRDMLNRESFSEREDFIQNNISKIQDEYSWPLIVEKYEKLFKKAIAE